jgi:hypothetical protein
MGRLLSFKLRGNECHGGKTEANGSDNGAHHCGLAVINQKRAASANMTINPDKPKATEVRIFPARKCRDTPTRRASRLAATAASATEACRRPVADTITTMTDITNAARTSNAAVATT